ncbi:MAG TPA: hypothetical protein VGD27_05400 [Longimicrobiales bacterium]
MTERPRATRGPQIKHEFEEHGFSLDELKEWKNQLEKAVTEHPILSASIAVGAGVLIARLIQDAMDEDTRKERKRRRGGLLGSELGRALMGSLATMAAAKIQETLLSDMQSDESEEEAPRPVRKRPRKQGRPGSSHRRPGTRQRKPAVEE